MKNPFVSEENVKAIGSLLCGLWVSVWWGCTYSALCGELCGAENLRKNLQSCFCKLFVLLSCNSFAPLFGLKMHLSCSTRLAEPKVFLTTLKHWTPKEKFALLLRSQWCHFALLHNSLAVVCIHSKSVFFGRVYFSCQKNWRINM